jgi:hypothetical protein
MVQKVDYYALLSRAVGSLDRDAYAARGVVYDREHKSLLKRLATADAPCSEADIAREEAAFRDAIRQVEFPEETVAAPPAPPRRQPAERAWRDSGRGKDPLERREIPPEPVIVPERAPPHGPRWRDAAAVEETAPEPLGAPIEPPAEVADARRKHRSIFGRIAAPIVVAAILVGLGTLGFATLIGKSDFSWLTLWTGQAAPAQRAVLRAATQSGEGGTAAVGKAIWRTTTEPTGSDGKGDAVVTIEVEIPEQKIALTVSLSRVSDANASMSHLMEMRFARPEDLPFGGIARIANVAMKEAETEPGESLIGNSIKISPGLFMFGMLGVSNVVEKNVQRLRTLGWLDFAVIFADGGAYSLSVEKGASGERALDEAFGKWGPQSG